MNCKQIKEVIQTGVFFDMNKEDQQIITQHLELCTECSVLKDELQRNSIFYKNLKKLDVEHQHPDFLTSKIVNKIQTEMISKKKSRVPISLIFFARQILRPVFISLSAFLLMLFLYQQGQMMNSLTELERRMNDRENLTTLKTEFTERFRAGKIMNKLMKKQQHNETTNIRLDRKSLEFLLEYGKKEKQNNDLIMKYLQSNYPEIAIDIEQLLGSESLPEKGKTLQHNLH